MGFVVLSVNYIRTENTSRKVSDKVAYKIGVNN